MNRRGDFALCCDGLRERQDAQRGAARPPIHDRAGGQLQDRVDGLGAFDADKFLVQAAKEVAQMVGI